MMSESGFSVLLASSPEYERLTAEIFLDGKFVALLTQEKAAGVFELETPGLNLREDLIARRVDLDEFLKCVEVARERLKS
jgi:hypothetical protein